MPTRPAPIAAVALLLAAPLGAQTVYSGTGATAFTQAAAFAAALPSPSTETFDARPNGLLTVSFPYAGGVATLSNGAGVTDAYPYGGGPVSPTRGYMAYPDGGVGNDPALAFTAPVRAFGAYFVDTELGDVLRFSLVGGGTQDFAIPIAGDGGVAFLGVDFGANAISGAVVDLVHDDAILIDDAVVAATAATVPEPRTLPLVAGVLLPVGGVALARRRRRDAGGSPAA